MFRSVWLKTVSVTFEGVNFVRGFLETQLTFHVSEIVFTMCIV